MFDDPTERKLALAEAVRHAEADQSIVSHLRAWLFRPGDARLILGCAHEAMWREMRR